MPVHQHDNPTADELIASCRSKGMRSTPALRSCFAVLLKEDRPLSIQVILDHESFTADCDHATLFRMLGRLEEHRIIRRIGIHSRAAHFVLNRNCHHDYLVCRECGDVQVLALDCPVTGLEMTVSRKSGYSEIEHELEFYGCCPACQSL